MSFEQIKIREVLLNSQLLNNYLEKESRKAITKIIETIYHNAIYNLTR